MYLFPYFWHLMDMRQGVMLLGAAQADLLPSPRDLISD